MKNVVNKVKEIRSLGTPTLLIIFSLLALVFKLALSFVKLISVWFVTDTGKKVIRLTTLFLGFATYLVSNLAIKIPWSDALLLALSGPGSLMVHELSMLIPGLKTLKDKREAPLVVSSSDDNGDTKRDEVTK